MVQLVQVPLKKAAQGSGGEGRSAGSARLAARFHDLARQLFLQSRSARSKGRRRTMPGVGLSRRHSKGGAS